MPAAVTHLFHTLFEFRYHLVTAPAPPFALACTFTLPPTTLRRCFLIRRYPRWAGSAVLPAAAHTTSAVVVCYALPFSPRPHAYAIYAVRALRGQRFTPPAGFLFHVLLLRSRFAGASSRYFWLPINTALPPFTARLASTPLLRHIHFYAGKVADSSRLPRGTAYFVAKKPCSNTGS